MNTSCKGRCPCICRGIHPACETCQPCNVVRVVCRASRMLTDQVTPAESMHMQQMVAEIGKLVG